MNTNWNWWPWPKITNLQNLVQKLKYVPIFLKFGTQNKSNMLITDIVTGIDDLEQNYKFPKFGPKAEICSNFFEIWHSAKLPICEIWS